MRLAARAMGHEAAGQQMEAFEPSAVGSDACMALIHVCGVTRPYEEVAQRTL